MITIREMARQLHISTKAMRQRLARAGIKPFKYAPSVYDGRPTVVGCYPDDTLDVLAGRAVKEIAMIQED
jgi:hypothetical protein